jgi:hypothetical protein
MRPFIAIPLFLAGMNQLSLSFSFSRTKSRQSANASSPIIIASNASSLGDYPVRLSVRPTPKQRPCERSYCSRQSIGLIACGSVRLCCSKPRKCLMRGTTSALSLSLSLSLRALLSISSLVEYYYSMFVTYS